KDSVRITAYPTEEWGGVVWVYMGPPEQKPELPRMEWALLLPAQRWVGKSLQECNWLQVMEGDIDSAHISYLHGGRPPGVPPRPGANGQVDGAPRLTVVDTDAGFSYGARRTMPNGDYYWRVTQFLLPMYALIPQSDWPKACSGTVPVDDQHSFRWAFFFNAEGGSPNRFGPGNGVQGQTATHKLNDGAVIDAGLPAQTKANNYLIDRQKQKNESYTGIQGIGMQDRAMTEGMGYICDRTQEHLGTTDVAIIAARRRLLKAARDLQAGVEPFAATQGNLYRVRSMDLVSPEPDLGRMLEVHGAEALAPAYE
ncbi:MAG: aromatic ring-hydroxylating dioxygenase subunit alpha, partial [Chloroflexota bacterium]|nr:aromatic ring-hydroxylating dioxygenase subunit alpha [Chloroflexota bacterium]